jgi:hypothetical protein
MRIKTMILAVDDKEELEKVKKEAMKLALDNKTQIEFDHEFIQYRVDYRLLFETIIATPIEEFEE